MPGMLCTYLSPESNAYLAQVCFVSRSLPVSQPPVMSAPPGPEVASCSRVLLRQGTSYPAGRLPTIITRWKKVDALATAGQIGYSGLDVNRQG